MLVFYLIPYPTRIPYTTKVKIFQALDLLHYTNNDVKLAFEMVHMGDASTTAPTTGGRPLVYNPHVAPKMPPVLKQSRVIREEKENNCMTEGQMENERRQLVDDDVVRVGRRAAVSSIDQFIN